MSISLPLVKSLSFKNRIVIFTCLLGISFIICVTANAQSPKAEKIVTQINQLIKEIKPKGNGALNTYTLDAGILTRHAKGGETFNYDLADVQTVAVQKDQSGMELYKDSYEVFLTFDMLGANDRPFWGIAKEQDALRLKKALEQLIKQVKAEKMEQLKYDQ